MCPKIFFVRILEVINFYPTRAHVAIGKANNIQKTFAFNFQKILNFRDNFIQSSTKIILFREIVESLFYLFSHINFLRYNK
jgi:hypothetical protein